MTRERGLVASLRKWWRIEEDPTGRREFLKLLGTISGSLALAPGRVIPEGWVDEVEVVTEESLTGAGFEEEVAMNLVQSAPLIQEAERQLAQEGKKVAWETLAALLVVEHNGATSSPDARGPFQITGEAHIPGENTPGMFVAMAVRAGEFLLGKVESMRSCGIEINSIELNDIWTQAMMAYWWHGANLGLTNPFASAYVANNMDEAHKEMKMLINGVWKESQRDGFVVNFRRIMEAKEIIYVSHPVI